MNNLCFITRKISFSSAHRLYNPAWNSEKNLQIFGACSHENWHGHNYILWVTVKGKINQETGFVMNLKDLSQLLQQEIVQYVDHKNLNLDVPFLQGKITSTENFAVAIWEQLVLKIEEKGSILHSVKLQETENNTVEYYG